MIRLQAMREAKRWSQRMLSEKSGVKQAVISLIEQGYTKNPRVDTISKLAQALECTIDVLVGEAEEQEER